MRARIPLALVLFGVLVVASGAAAAPSARQQLKLPPLEAYHFTGTPLILEFFDGGPSGRIGVIFEFNRNGIVPGSHAAVITPSFDIVVAVDVNQDLVQERIFTRSGGTNTVPDYAKLFLEGRLPPMTEVPPRTRLVDPGTETVFFFFVNDTTGDEKLVSNPERNGALIAGTAALQVSEKVLEIFPIDADGRTSASTEIEIEQLPLVGNLDNARGAIYEAQGDEFFALRLLQEEGDLVGAKGKKYKAKLANSRSVLGSAVSDLNRARNAGELSAPEHKRMVSELSGAIGADIAAGKSEAPKDMKRAIAHKKKALALVKQAKVARQNGK